VSKPWHFSRIFGSPISCKIIGAYFVTTLYDFYGFKGLSDNETKKTLEEKIKNGVKQGQQHKIIPYVQMYEFEALLFSDSVKMASGLKTNQDWINEVINDFSDLETINNSKETAPSKRIDLSKNQIYLCFNGCKNAQ
jgi:hypothetical protein